MADPTLSQLIGGLLDYGPIGTAFGVAGFVIWTLYKRNEALNDAIRDMAVNATTAQASTTTALNRLSELLTVRKEG
jgi:hypothetical protein